ncbi:DUF4251 domain-containing protein [Saccharicrinis sp. FJH62]|uniref:DUF4251 domain-containing protein n=1 Tax=Saccharicrinis sp. FJH62 TaxID=3344657 RepID=UPI0035D47277
MKKLIVITILILAVAGIKAQDQQKLSRKDRIAQREAEAIKETREMVDSASFVFVPTQALPLSMRTQNLDGTFRAKIQNDSIDSYLPFYGRAYKADYNSLDGPFSFDLPIEKYSTEKLKKQYLVQFQVQNNDDLVKFMFYIGETGYTTLTITSTNRQSISFYGNIEKPEK